MLPPEVNSARMYSGAGSTPMLTAAAGWDRLAVMLTSAADSYRAVTGNLIDGGWQGSSAAAMAAAAEPYATWMTATAAQAAQTANQARSAAAAYEAAFAATVPPPVITANRTALSTLVNTNVFGQNTAAIAANQADYHQMWAQDAAAMHAYAAGSAAAAPNSSALTAAPQTTNPAGAA
ncbi:PPE family protein, partial [Mycobacterium sp. M1]